MFLSGDDEFLLIGNFLADFLQNREVRELPPEVRQGVALHRKIDSFTDQHPMVLKGVRRLRPTHRKFAPVVLDICQDYLLSMNWDKYSEASLEAFRTKVYEVIIRNIDVIPDRLQDRTRRMVEGNWLETYSTIEGLQYTFQRIKLRTRFPRYFDHSVRSLQQDYELYEKEFNLFFPDVIEVSQNHG